MAEEFFYGVTLTKSKPKVVWDPENKDEYPRSNKLVVKQILLGLDAAENEYNVVQAEAMTIRDTINIPIAILKAGEIRQARLDLDFPDSPVTFTLVEGSGPVHIHGQHLSEVEEFDIEDIEEMGEEMVDEEEEDDEELKDKQTFLAKGKFPAINKNLKKK